VIGQLGIGGAEKQLYYLVRGLDRRRFHPLVVSLSAGGYWANALRDEGVEVIELERKKNVEIARLLRVIGTIRRFRPVIVHTYLSSANSYGRIAAVLCGVPILIASERSYFLPASRFIRFMDSELSRFTSVIICNTTANVRFLRENHRLHSEIMTIYNGIQALPANGANRDALRGEFGFASGDLVVGTIGNLTPPKNHHFLLRVAQRLLERPEFAERLRFIIIGGGVLEKELRALAAELGIASRVTFAGQRENAVEYLRAFDAFIMTSHYEGLSNAIMEAMLYELPCVVTDVGGNCELVTEGETGYVVDAGDRTTFADRVATQLADPALRRAMGARGAKRILNEFSLGRMVGETEEKYEELLERRLGR
jgi:glycosyltransferase involved in cell wall biosynthesis